MEDKLNYSSILSSRAQKEIAISWNWYEERQQRNISSNFSFFNNLQNYKDEKKHQGSFGISYFSKS
jgi:hypothetical protein